MPHKKNNRKAIQKAKLDADAKPKKPRVGMIAHTPHGGSGATLAIAIATAFPGMIAAADMTKSKEG